MTKTGAVCENIYVTRLCAYGIYPTHGAPYKIIKWLKNPKQKQTIAITNPHTIQKIPQRGLLFFVFLGIFHIPVSVRSEDTRVLLHDAWAWWRCVFFRFGRNHTDANGTRSTDNIQQPRQQQQHSSQLSIILLYHLFVDFICSRLLVRAPVRLTMYQNSACRCH